MIHILNKIPNRVTVACSGGLDSMAIVNFLLNGKKKVDLAYFNHDTIHAKEAEQFVKRFAGVKRLNLVVGRVKGQKGRKSLEEFWRDERYAFFNSLGSPFIITCHHLDDCVETWLMSSLHGQGKLIPYNRNNIYRPFLLTEKSELKDYVARHDIDWVEDPSNSNTNHSRNYVRRHMMPHVLRVNPGIKKTIRKKIIEIYQ